MSPDWRLAYAHSLILVSSTAKGEPIGANVQALNGLTPRRWLDSMPRIGMFLKVECAAEGGERELSPLRLPLGGLLLLPLGPLLLLPLGPLLLLPLGPLLLLPLGPLLRPSTRPR
jgi:hypothetical protein